jgi:hypothetical protein
MFHPTQNPDIAHRPPAGDFERKRFTSIMLSRLSGRGTIFNTYCLPRPS